jgi:hypothetical protein
MQTVCTPSLSIARTPCFGSEAQAHRQLGEAITISFKNSEWETANTTTFLHRADKVVMVS